MVQDKSAANRIIDAINYLLLTAVALAAVLPFVYVVAVSFTAPSEVAKGGLILFPKEWSLSAYRYIFSTNVLINSLLVTILITVAGTLINLVFTSLMAYPLSRQRLRGRQAIMLGVLFTMLFSGGMIPTYIVVTQVLGLKDSIWALIWPLAMNAFYIMILRTFYMTSVPDAVIESGKIDGAGEFKVFYRLVLPLSLPGLATIGLFSTLGYWNDWFNALLYIDDPDKVPLQSMLMRIESSMSFIQQNSNNSSFSLEILQNMPQDTARMAMVVLATLPIVFAYPFFQRYFVQGLTVGSVKE